MTRFLLVTLGGALGSGVRYLVSVGVPPYGTLVVNIAGSFAMGALVQLLPPGDLRVFVTTGILGGFTTYSSFNEETLLLARAGSWGTAAANVGLTVFACLAAGMAGVWAARAVGGR